MTQETHIASAYDRDLETIQTLVMRMGGLVEQAINDGAEALLSGDLDLAEQVRAGDTAVDALEQKINEEATRTIALRAPVSKDLRVILATLRLAASLERIGDYAKNVAKRTRLLASMTRIKESEAGLRRMSREVQVMLNDTLDAFLRSDIDLAEQVRQRDFEVDQMYNTLFREFLTFMMEDPRNITPCMHLHFIAKNTERMGDLVTNMAEQIIYLKTGVMPGEARPKGESVQNMPESMG